MRVFLLSALSLLTVCGTSVAQSNGPERSVLTNRFGDNWTASFGIEGLSFYSSGGSSLNGNPFNSCRASIGAAATATKWWSPEIGTRTKFSGYWGKALVGQTAEENRVKFFSFQEQALFNILNLTKGYDATRRWGLVPYTGVGIARNCSFNETSITAGLGVLNTYRITNLLRLHADIGITFANGSEKIQGSYRWLHAEIGLTVSLGRYTWSRQKDEQGNKIYLAPVKKQASQRTVSKKSEYQKVIAEAPVPEGMVLVNRGHIRMGLMEMDTLWAAGTPVRDVSVDDFWMDKTEVTNKQYREFIKDICDTLIAQRLNDPYYMGDYERVKESLYITNPVTGEKILDARQLTYRYEVYDYEESMKRKYRLDPKERNLNTDAKVDSQVVWITKDTAYVNKMGNIVRETINRPLTGPYDFLNTYIVNVFPDTTCWVNDFPNSDNGRYSRYYFSHPDYKDYPVVGVTWEQANAYCVWRTAREQKDNKENMMPYRLPTEAEWEYAARSTTDNIFPWDKEKAEKGKGLFLANFMPEEGDLTKDGNIITSRVGIYPANPNGLYDMAGNVAEWTSTLYSPTGVEAMNTINPQLRYNAAEEDPYRLKRKSVKGGSWKDPESHIRSAWRTGEYQNQPRSYIGFRCVRSLTTTQSERTIIIVNDK